ncbi:MAG: hypothetical protein IJ518_05900 [Clostridia bacterium]|nr:hypothetical protein [Clostridia bacterium]
MEISNGWKVLQDIDGIGDVLGLYRFGAETTRFGGDPGVKPLEPWQPIRIGCLQPQLASDRFHGRELRQFNEAPWWYANEFVWEDTQPGATLTFHGVDYYADVWLNEEYLGAHEGYGTPFSFEVGERLRRGEVNRLVVKVSAPWDHEVMDEQHHLAFVALVRGMLKGTYEHNDSFVPRDVNPIGIWNKVTLTAHAGAVLTELFADSALNGDFSAATVTVTGLLDAPAGDYTVSCTLYDEDGTLCTDTSYAVTVGEKAASVTASLTLEQPKLWTVWERGVPHRYQLCVAVSCEETVWLRERRWIGIRKLDFVRTPEEFSVWLNGEKLYLRGATYFPTLYLSEQTPGIYNRDIDRCIKDGMNALRVHVHTEKDEFYDLCDEKGVLLIQDTDFNWVHPLGEAFAKRAVTMCREMLVRLRNHPSIFAWVMLNEARHSEYFTLRPGPQMMELGRQMGGGRLCIQNSWDVADWEQSGDSHNYDGSLAGNHTHYLDIYGNTERLNTEFGMDGIPCESSLRHRPDICRRLGPVMEGIDSVQEYQYRYVKYFIEYYRLQKNAPNSGYFHFLWSDPAPTSWFGAYDWLGVPKMAQRAYLESNQPIAVMLELDKTGTRPVALWIVNDTLRDFAAKVVLQVTDADSHVLGRVNYDAQVGRDSLVKVGDWSAAMDDISADATVLLSVYDEQGIRVAWNRYEKAFCPPPHPAGHPDNMDFGMGMHLYWAI